MFPILFSAGALPRARGAPGGLPGTTFRARKARGLVCRRAGGPGWAAPIRWGARVCPGPSSDPGLTSTVTDHQRVASAVSRRRGTAQRPALSGAASPPQSWALDRPPLRVRRGAWGCAEAGQALNDGHH